MTAVPAQQIAWPNVVYANNQQFSPLDFHEDKPQWNLNGKTFLEWGINAISGKMLVLLPTGSHAVVFIDQIGQDFAQHCVDILGEELQKYAGL